MTSTLFPGKPLCLLFSPPPQQASWIWAPVQHTCCPQRHAHDVGRFSQQLALISVKPSALVLLATIDVRDDFVEVVLPIDLVTLM